MMWTLAITTFAVLKLATLRAVIDPHANPRGTFGYLLFHVYYAFIGLCLLSFGVGSWCFVRELASGAPLARGVRAFLAAFWTLRWIAALLLDVRPHLVNTWWRTGYAATNVVFCLLTFVHAWGAARPDRAPRNVLNARPPAVTHPPPPVTARSNASRAAASVATMLHPARPATVLLSISALAASLLFAPAFAQSPQPKRPPAPPRDSPGPWDNDLVVYRIPAADTTEPPPPAQPSPPTRRSPPETLATFPRGGVATAARLPDGRLAIAHQHFPENDAASFDKVAIRFSADEGRSWSALTVITLRGLPEGMRFPFDPMLVPLPDGRVRLYFTSHRSHRQGRPDPDANLPAIYSAISENAVDFTFEPGARFTIEGRGVIDCAVALHRGTFHLFAPDNGAGNPFNPGRDPRPPEDRPREGVGYHATSKDGLAFTRVDDVRVAGHRRWLGDAKSDGEALTFFGTGEGGIWTATSPDGITWTLGAPLRGLAAADPGTAKLQDGALLVVGTGPPRPGTPGAQRRGKNSPPPRPASRDSAP